MGSPLSARPGKKFEPRIALVGIDARSAHILTRSFAQCAVQSIPIGEDFAKRLVTQKFEGCVVELNEQAPAVLETIRSSRSNHRAIVYGILSNGIDVRRYSKYGINAVLESPLDRAAVLNVARSTCALLLHELRRYVRIPLVVEITGEGAKGSISGSSREISGGGMSVQFCGATSLSDRLRLTFTLPGKPTVSLQAAVCWKRDPLTGLQFQDSDPARQVVKDWINSFLGLD